MDSDGFDGEGLGTTDCEAVAGRRLGATDSNQLNITYCNNDKDDNIIITKWIKISLNETDLLGEQLVIE
jgi:hypothetical protein